VSHGLAGLGRVWRDVVRSGWVRHGMDFISAIKFDGAEHGKARRGEAGSAGDWLGGAGSGLVRFGLAVRG
jgi:hypothetical protein